MEDNIWGDVVLILGVYLLGSVPHLFLLGRLRGINLEGDLHHELWQRGEWLPLYSPYVGQFAPEMDKLGDKCVSG